MKTRQYSQRLQDALLLILGTVSLNLYCGVLTQVSSVCLKRKRNREVHRECMVWTAVEKHLRRNSTCKILLETSNHSALPRRGTTTSGPPATIPGLYHSQASALVKENSMPSGSFLSLAPKPRGFCIPPVTYVEILLPSKAHYLQFVFSEKLFYSRPKMIKYQQS